MKIAYPWMLLLLGIVPLFGLFAWYRGRQRDDRILSLVALRLQPSLVGEAASRRLRFWLFLGGLGCAILALVRPQWGELADKRNGVGRDVIIAVDVSRSMLANDLPPSRLKRAKLAAEDLVNQLRSKSLMEGLDSRVSVTRIGLVAFAGSAFLQAPVTSDYAAVLAAIQELDPELIPLPGTNISEALRVAVEAFDHSEGGQKALILISDGEDLEADGIAVAKELAGQIRVFTMGVGTPEGAVLSVPSPRGGMEYIRDQAGNVVQSHLDETRLTELANAGGGFYLRLLSGPAEMRRIVQEGILQMEKHEMMQEGKVRAIDRYQWPLGVALLLIGVGLLLGEKVKRKVFAVVMVFLTVLPEGGLATTGRELYDSGDYAGAKAAFEAELEKRSGQSERAYNLGAAAYKNKNWSEAIESFGAALATSDSELRSKAEYNFANALVQQARQGRRGVDTKGLEQAVEHYNEALNRNPKLEDAAYNRDVVRKILAKKEEEKQKQDKKDKGEKKDDKDQKQDKDKEKDSSKKDGSSEDKKDDKSEDGEDKKEGKDGQDDKDQQGKDGKGKKGKDGEKSDSDKTDGKQEKPDKEDPSSEPKPEKDMESKQRGELKDDPVSGDGKKGSDKEGKEQQVQAGAGKLSKEQASALVEALRSEDRRVQLWTPNTQQQKEAKGREGRTW